MRQKPRGITSARDIAEWYIKKATRLDCGCLISHLKPNKKGYIPIQLGGRTGPKFRLHRFIYHTLVEPVPEELFVLHSCDQRNCIELDHLRVGTAADNTADMMIKGRNKYVRPTGAKWSAGGKWSKPGSREHGPKSFSSGD